MIGKQLAQFKITGEIGQGAMGTVYRAEDSESNREVAIKVLPAVFSEDQERLDRFGREAKILASLDHPNIGAIYGVEILDGKTCLILQWVEGEALAERLKRGALSLEAALLYSRQIADALSAAHQREVIHRDLKPGNIHLIDGRRVKVLDFGIAKLNIDDPESKMAQVMAETDSNAATVSPASLGFLGTPAYMSPEQAQGLMIDHRTDIWAFGCCLFEMLTGQPAYQAETTADLIQAVQEGPPDWSLLPSETPAAVMTLLRRCLEKEAYRRLSNIGDIALTLEEVCHLERSVPKTPGSGTQSAPSHSFMPAWAVVLMLVAVAVAGFSFWKSGPGPQDSVLHEMKTLAILPFDVPDDDASLKLVGEGLVEEVLRDLRRVRIAGVGTLDRGIREGASEEPADELGVDGLLVGSLGQTNGRLTVALRIVSERGRESLWETNLVESLPLVMARNITQCVVDAVAPDGNFGGISPTNAVDQVGLATYSDYRRGFQELQTRGGNFRTKALGHFESAMERDANFVPLYVELAMLHAALPMWGGHSATPSEGAQNALNFLQDAVGRFPQSQEIAMARAFLQGLANQDWSRFQNLMVNRVLSEGEDSAVEARMDAYYTMLVEARYRDSLRLLSTASEISPGDPRNQIARLLALSLSGADQEALKLNQTLVDQFPNDWSLRLMLALNLKRLAGGASGSGDLSEALAAAEAAVSGSRRVPATLCVLAEIHAARKDEQEVSNLLNELNQQAANGQVVPSTWLARVEAARGNPSEAIAYLEKAHENHEGVLLLTHLRSLDLMTALSSEKNFWRLMDLLGLPQLPLGHPFREFEQQNRYRGMEVANGELRVLGVVPFAEESDSWPDRLWLGETFRDGVVDQLKMARIDGFSVKPVSGGTDYLGGARTGITAGEIDHLLTGTYRVEEDRVVVTAKLEDLQSGAETGSLTQSGHLSDLPRFIGQLSAALVRQVAPDWELGNESLTTSDGLNAAAYLAYREGLWAGKQPNRQELTFAIEQLTKAMRLSPGVATPYLALARMIGDASQWGGLGVSQGQVFLQRDSLLRTADSKAPNSLAVIAEKGWQALVGNWAWNEAYQHFTEARGTLRGLHGLVWYKAFVEGRFDDADDLLKEGLDRAPGQFDFLVARARIAEAKGDFAGAIEIYDRIGSDRLTWREMAQLSQLCARIGQAERASTLANQFTAIAGDLEWALIQLATVQGLSGQISEATQSLNRAREAGGDVGLPEMDYADAYLAINQVEQALFALESGALEQSGWTLLQLRSAPLISALADEPRYWALVEQLDFPPLPLQHASYRKEQEIRYDRSAL